MVHSTAHMRCEGGNTTGKLRKETRRKHEENAQNPCPDGTPPQSRLTSGCCCFRFGGDVLPFCSAVTRRIKVLSLHLYKEDTVSCVAILNNEKERKRYKGPYLLGEECRSPWALSGGLISSPEGPSSVYSSPGWNCFTTSPEQ